MARNFQRPLDIDEELKAGIQEEKPDQEPSASSKDTKKEVPAGRTNPTSACNFN